MISVDELSSIMDRSYIIVDLKSINKSDAINEMLFYAKSNGLEINIEKIIDIINNKEAISSSGIGYGVAFPHVRTKELDKNKLIFAISRKGVDYNSKDKKPVHFLVMFLTALNQTENNNYLSFLALITRIARLSMYIVLLMESNTQEEFKNTFINIYRSILEDDNKRL